MAAPALDSYLSEAKQRMESELETNGNWTPATQLVKDYLEGIETDQEILAICHRHRVILLRDIDMRQFGHRENTSVIKIMRYAIGDYLFTQLREFEFHLIARLDVSMNAL